MALEPRVTGVNSSIFAGGSSRRRLIDRVPREDLGGFFSVHVRLRTNVSDDTIVGENRLGMSYFCYVVGGNGVIYGGMPQRAYPGDGMFFFNPDNLSLGTASFMHLVTIGIPGTQGVNRLRSMEAVDQHRTVKGNVTTLPYIGKEHTGRKATLDLRVLQGTLKRDGKPTRRVTQHRLLYVLQGRGDIYLGDDADRVGAEGIGEELTPGSIAFIPSGVPYNLLGGEKDGLVYLDVMREIRDLV